MRLAGSTFYFLLAALALVVKPGSGLLDGAREVAEGPHAETTTTAAELPAPDAGADDASTADAAREPSNDGPTLIAFTTPAPIFSATEWPARDPNHAAEERKGVSRLGYLRKGGKVAIKPTPIAKGNCAEGWYELVSGGFVCGKFATTDPKHKELRFTPHAPWLDKPLPYEYGLNLTPGTPLYRRIPLKSERAEFEKALAVGRGAKSSDVAKKLKTEGGELPAYLKDEGGPSKPRLAFSDLKGENMLIAERMLRGFYLALDEKVDGRSGLFFRTTSGLLAPKDHILVHKPKSDVNGVMLGEGEGKRKLPLGWVIGAHASKFELGEKKATRGDKVDRFAVVGVTGKRRAIGTGEHERVYFETTDGYWLRDADLAIVTEPTKVPADVGEHERWIDVDLGSQALVAYEGKTPMFATVVSTGRHSTDPAKDHTTAMGSFRIREKHVTATMDDDAASDGTYKIEDVPWVMYFEKSYALHGAFWHSGFGREKSHGCVNLAPADARYLFHWVGPNLPEGWHGVIARPENPGTRVVVHK